MFVDKFKDAPLMKPNLIIVSLMRPALIIGSSISWVKIQGKDAPVMRPHLIIGSLISWEQIRGKDAPKMRPNLIIGSLMCLLTNSKMPH